MRRIDLFCKLVGPLAIAFVDSASPRLAIVITGGVSTASTLVEYFAIARVYNAVPDLQAEKASKDGITTSGKSTLARFRDMLTETSVYIHHPVFLPSLSFALLHLTVLSFSGQMITYLSAMGLSSALIGGLRGISTIFELSATWIAPKLIARIGLVRAGMWFLNWEIACVAVACLFLWLNHSTTTTVVGTISAVIASRVGLWGYDLCAQNIVQDVCLPATPIANHSANSSSRRYKRMFVELSRPESLL